MRGASFLLLLVLLTGCLPQKGAKEMLPPAPGYQQADTPLERLDGFQIARGFAGPDTVIEPVPTAVLLLNAKAHARNITICEAFLGLPAVGERLSQSLVDPNLIVTRMLLGRVPENSHRMHDCNYLLSIYDYARSQELMERMGLEDGAGPFFVVIFPPDPSIQATPFLALDTAPLSVAQLDGFVGKWQETLWLASREQKEVRNEIARDAPAQESPLCDSVGQVVRATMPVLAAMGAAALVAEYPAVVLVAAAFKEKDEGGKAVGSMKESLGKFYDSLADGAKKGCSRLRVWLGGWLKERSGRGAEAR